MPAAALEPFLSSPYGMLVVVRMLTFFRSLPGLSSYVVLGFLVASVFVQNFWCRYLCPYGAVLGLAALASTVRITRNESSCSEGAKCAKACPSALKVDKLVQIGSAECTGGLECVAVCPADGALQMALPRLTSAARRMPTWVFAAGVAVIFVGVVGFAKTASHWTSDVPSAVYKQLVPHANEARHPMPGDPGLQ